MFDIWMKTTILERWLLIIIGIAGFGVSGIITMIDGIELYALGLITLICIIRIVVKGVWLNGKVK